MIVDVFLSIIILPTLWNAQFNFDGFLNLNNQLSADLKDIGPKRVYTDYLDVEISATSALAVDAKSGKILYKKNETKVLPIASITKLMTALVFLDYNPGWETEWFTVPADRRNGGIIHLNTGEVLTLNNLFKTALIASDNDSAVALARATGLNEQDFVDQMNLKAKQLGLLNTHFAEPTGLKMTNESTVGDIVKLLNFALQNETIAKTTSTSYYEFEIRGPNKTRTVKLRNTDTLLKSYLNILGGKTGSLEVVGYNLAVKLKGENNQEVIVAALGSQSNSERFQDVKAITDWIFANYDWSVK